jgi:hypothetical protein
MHMKRSIAAVAVTAAIMTAGTTPAFAAHTGHAAPVKMTDTTTYSKYVFGHYLIIVRYVKDDPLPKQFTMPMTLQARNQQVGTAGQITTLQRGYESLAKGSIQVFMLKPADPKKVVKHVQRHLVHAHAHVNTGFGGEARQVERHFPAGYASLLVQGEQHQAHGERTSR